MIDWKVRWVTAESSLGFDKRYDLDTLPDFLRGKKTPRWWRRILSRG